MKDSCIAWGTVRDAAETRMPMPSVPHMNTAESPYSSARLPRIGTSKTKCATRRAIVIWPYATRRFGMILPSSSSQRRIGLTTSASSVPRSRSRTIAMAMTLTVVCIRRAPISPGTMKMADTRSGLYQARTRTSSGGASTLPDRSTTAVGTCLTSVLIARPKMKSMATGTNSMSVSASRSRQSWRNSFAMMPWSRLPTSTPPGFERSELLAHARLALAIDERHEEVLHVRLDLVDPLHGDAVGREVLPHGRDREVPPRGDEPHASARADHLLDGVPIREDIGGGPRVHRLEVDHGSGQRYLPLFCQALAVSL